MQKRPAGDDSAAFHSVLHGELTGSSGVAAPWEPERDHPVLWVLRTEDRGMSRCEAAVVQDTCALVLQELFLQDDFYRGARTETPAVEQTGVQSSCPTHDGCPARLLPACSVSPVVVGAASVLV